MDKQAKKNESLLECLFKYQEHFDKYQQIKGKALLEIFFVYYKLEIHKTYINKIRSLN